MTRSRRSEAALAVIFDLDGLLVDTEPLWTESSDALLARRGQRFDPALKPRIMGHHPGEVARILIDHYGLSEEPEALLAERFEILTAIYDRGIEPMPGAVRLVEQLYAASVPQAVASGSPTWLVRRVLEQLALGGCFEAALGSDEVKRGKPAPDTFLIAAERLGVEPAVCVVLEDSGAGVEAALAAGMGCVAVPSPETDRAVARRADRVVDSLLDVDLEFLRTISASRRSKR